MLPEERARVRIDKQLSEAGWDIVARNEYVPKSAAAVKEALMQGNTESDYLLFVDDKAIAVVEAKREENPLADDVENQAEGYSSHPQGWYGLWFDKQIPLVYLANGNKIYFKNITTRGISQQLKNYADKYGLDKKVVYPHSFRHRYAKNFLEKYNDIALLADLMGHESIETTRIYLRRTASEQQALVDKIVTW